MFWLKKRRLISQNWKRLKSGYQLQVQQAGSQPVGHGKNGVGEILDEHVGDGVVPVDEIEHFQGSPYVLEVPERTMAAAIAFFTIEQ